MSECTHGNMTAHGNPCPWCKNTELQAELAALREAAGEAKDLLWKMQNVQPYSDEIHYVGALLNTELLKERSNEHDEV